jgi:hypothetical protein
MSIEYECCECRRLIILITSDLLPHPPICQMCLHSPGWFRIPELRAVVDAGHDGRDPADGEPA